jgi:hypothetical protein
MSDGRVLRLALVAAGSDARCTTWLLRSRVKGGAITYEHDLACHPFPEQFVRVSCFDERKSLRD